jgi:hypothetical protein
VNIFLENVLQQEMGEEFVKQMVLVLKFQSKRICNLF